MFVRFRFKVGLMVSGLKFLRLRILCEASIQSLAKEAYRASNHHNYRFRAAKFEVCVIRPYP